MADRGRTAGCALPGCRPLYEKGGLFVKHEGARSLPRHALPPDSGQEKLRPFLRCAQRRAGRMKRCPSHFRWRHAPRRLCRPDCGRNLGDIDSACAENDWEAVPLRRVRLGGQPFRPADCRFLPVQPRSARASQLDWQSFLGKNAKAARQKNHWRSELRILGH